MDPLLVHEEIPRSRAPFEILVSAPEQPEDGVQRAVGSGTVPVLRVKTPYKGINYIGVVLGPLKTT